MVGDERSLAAGRPEGQQTRTADRESLERLVLDLGNPEGHGRVTAAEKLGATGDSRARWALLPLLSDPFFLARRAAARALTALGWQPGSVEARALHLTALEQWTEAAALGPVAVPFLVHALDREDRQVFPGLIDALVSLGESVVHPLIRRSHEVGDPARIRILGILARIASPTARPFLIGLLGECSVALRQAALRGLCELHDRESLSALLDHLPHEEEAGVSRAMIRSLADWGPSALEDDRVRAYLARRERRQNGDELWED